MAARAWVGLVRAVNVGGTGKLPMAELAAACRAAGLTEVKTYLASGNVVFVGTGTEAEIVAALEAKLSQRMGRPVAVMLRTADELSDALQRNPFADREPSRTLVFFLPKALVANDLAATGQKDEEIAAGGREIFVYYARGVGDSRLRIRAAETGTARNLNTVRKLETMARAVEALRGTDATAGRLRG